MNVGAYLFSSRVQIRIAKTVKRRRYKNLQFFYDCYCNVLSNDMCLYYVNDPITNKKIQSRTKWFTIEPMIKEIYIQLKDEILQIIKTPNKDENK